MNRKIQESILIYNNTTSIPVLNVDNSLYFKGKSITNVTHPGKGYGYHAIDKYTKNKMYVHSLMSNNFEYDVCNLTHIHHLNIIIDEQDVRSLINMSTINYNKIIDFEGWINQVVKELKIVPAHKYEQIDMFGNLPTQEKLFY